ncbi:MAG: hypothetical protein ACREL5_09910 [Gemmatimonadales bacterium]
MRSHIAVVAILMLPVTSCAQKSIPAEQQIALAVLPLPNSFRAGASVLGYDSHGKLVTLRKGSGVMTCLGTNPADSMFHAACYANSMEPFMAAGRALRNRKVANVDSARFAEVKAGTIPMPSQPAALWGLDGPMSGVDVAKGTVTSAIKLRYLLYMPYATAAATGLPDQPISNGPWLMDAGTAKAHIMFTPTM